MLTPTCSYSEQAVLPGYCRLYDPAVLEQRLGTLKGMSDRLLDSELRRAKKLGPIRRLATPPSLAALTQLANDYPHFASVVELARQRAALAEVTPGRVFTMPPVLLTGHPGVGKTAFCEALAAILSLPVRRVDMAATSAGFVLSGSHPSWSSARPGAAWSLLQSPIAAGVLMLDELDKTGNSDFPPLGPLYSLLEPSSARHFSDEFIEVAVDASYVLTFATCNDSAKIESALRTRFVEFVIPEPSPQQMRAIATSVYRTKRARAQWGEAFPAELDPMVAEHLATCTPREVSSLLEAAVAHAASKRRLRVEPVDIEYAQAMRQQRSPQPRYIGFI